MAKHSGAGRGQLRKRGARTWRDTTNPTGPGHAPGEPEPEPATEALAEPGEGADRPTDEDQPNTELVQGGPTAGPGGGGATQSPAGAKRLAGLHGGQTRKA